MSLGEKLMLKNQIKDIKVGERPNLKFNRKCEINERFKRNF